MLKAKKEKAQSFILQFLPQTKFLQDIYYFFPGKFLLLLNKGVIKA